MSEGLMALSEHLTKRTHGIAPTALPGQFGHGSLEEPLKISRQW